MREEKFKVSSNNGSVPNSNYSIEFNNNVYKSKRGGCYIDSFKTRSEAYDSIVNDVTKLNATGVKITPQ